MRTKNEIQQLKQELEILTGFITDYGIKEEIKNSNYACDIIDALWWVLEEITTEHFESDAYLDLFKLRAIAENIEHRTGKKKNGNLS